MTALFSPLSHEQPDLMEQLPLLSLPNFLGEIDVSLLPFNFLSMLGIYAFVFGYLVFAPRFSLVTSSDLTGLGCASIRNIEVVYRVTSRALVLTDHSTYPRRECVFFSSTK